MRREWIEITVSHFEKSSKPGLPPCGGSGLKSLDGLAESINETSPSMRREWIEIEYSFEGERLKTVSLHAEGVD